MVSASVVALWFLADGTIGLVSGDYINPRTGEYTGQLGPWSKVVSAIGIEPRSIPMKTIFVTYGALWLMAIVSYVVGAKLSWTLMLIAAIGSLWYLPFGTVLGIIQIGLLYRVRNTNMASG